MHTEVCWFDAVGDRWEAEGVPPCRIFEFHVQMAPELLPGGMIESAVDERPDHPLKVKRIVVRMHNGEELEHGPGWPLFLAAARVVLPDLC